jgi:dolichol kinase
MLCILAVAAAAVASAGYLVRHPAKSPAFASILALVFRPTESRWNNGGMYYLAGVAIAVALLPTQGAVAGWLILAGGDSFANLVGRRAPLYLFGKKSLGGMVGFFIGALLLCPVVLELTPISPGAYMAAAAIAALGETFIPWMNDNVWLAPVGGLLTIIFHF